MGKTTKMMIAAGFVVTATAITLLVAFRTRVVYDVTGHPTTAVVTVEGLTCELCVRRLEDRLSLMPGVKRATVDLARQAAGVTFQDGKTISHDDLMAAVRDAGYQPVSVEWGKDLSAFPILAQLVVHGKQTPACGERLKGRVQNEDGVRSVVVDIDKGATTVVYDPERTTVTDVIAIVREGLRRCGG